MSIKVMAYVWEYSKHKGTKLLLMLALADHANDSGLCWPGIPRLAKKIRCSKRQTKRLLKALESSEELEIEYNQGRGNTNLYRITVVKGDTHDTFLNQEKVTSGAEKVTSGAEKGDIAMSPEPSLTVNKPSYIPDGGSSNEEILDFPDIQPKEKRDVQEIKQGIVNALAEYEGNLEPLMEAIDKVSVTNTNWHSKTSQRFLRTLRDDCKATPQKIHDFGQWWMTNHWLGQKGNPPRLQQIYEEWPKFENNNHTGFRM